MPNLFDTLPPDLPEKAFDALLETPSLRVEWTTPDEPTVWLAIHYSQSTS